MGNIAFVDGKELSQLVVRQDNIVCLGMSRKKYWTTAFCCLTMRIIYCLKITGRSFQFPSEGLYTRSDWVSQPKLSEEGLK